MFKIEIIMLQNYTYKITPFLSEGNELTGHFGIEYLGYHCIGLDNGMVPNTRQTIINATVDFFHAYKLMHLHLIEILRTILILYL